MCIRDRATTPSIRPPRRAESHNVAATHRPVLPMHQEDFKKTKARTNISQEMGSASKFSYIAGGGPLTGLGDLPELDNPQKKKKKG